MIYDVQTKLNVGWELDRVHTHAIHLTTRNFQIQIFFFFALSNRASRVPF